MAGLVLSGAKTIGPGPWLPSQVIGTTSTVFANGRQILVREDDRVITHIKPGDDPSPKSGLVIASSAKVFIEGKRVAQLADICTEGEVIVECSTNVFVV
ncbi:gp5.4 conserved hypothetical protein [Aeromonas phage 65]|uniref:Phospholipase n=2 Tax=Ishigurovirus osborne TaxID=260149 RepID=A0A219YCR8_9CAUD|nr:PAAR motif of membran proteins [Aeromonas phage 65]ADQ53114.1 gp5.4 conserved hypothetical protein [Aeromonas phage 65]APU01493.1 phospholipase [Aeromonas phage 65.2]